MVKKFLVTTSHKETWPNNNEKIIFLGEWCKLYSDKSYWENLDSEVLNYHWDNRDKFERDYQQQLTYEFIRSFPLSISSMPVSFDASSLLKVTVSMSYIRYIVLKTPTKTGTQGTSNPANRLNPSSQAQANSDSFRNVFGNNLPLGANDLLRFAGIT